jgi:hypothetical protein
MGVVSGMAVGLGVASRRAIQASDCPFGLIPVPVIVNPSAETPLAAVKLHPSRLI